MSKQKTAQQWQLLIEQQAKSELSVAEFCQQHEINTKTFYNQRTKLRQEKAPSQFVAAKPSAPPPSPSVATMTLSLEKIKLVLPATTDPIWLAHLLKALS